MKCNYLVTPIYYFVYRITKKQKANKKSWREALKKKLKKYTRYKIKHERTLTKRILEHAKQKSLKDEEDKARKIKSAAERVGVRKKIETEDSIECSVE